MSSEIKETLNTCFSDNNATAAVSCFDIFILEGVHVYNVNIEQYVNL